MECDFDFVNQKLTFFTRGATKNQLCYKLGQLVIRFSGLIETPVVSNITLCMIVQCTIWSICTFSLIMNRSILDKKRGPYGDSLTYDLSNHGADVDSRFISFICQHDYFHQTLNALGWTKDYTNQFYICWQKRD